MKTKTIEFEKPIIIKSAAAVMGKKEGHGPLAGDFDFCLDDDYFGEDSWEKAESKIQTEAIRRAISKAGVPEKKIDAAFCGDLLNQCVASHYAVRDLEIPFLGVYGACSTMAEAMLVGSVAVSSGHFENVICATSSHFCSAEKQFRFPLDYGGQRPPTAQWTVTGAGCALISDKGTGPKIRAATAGTIIDMGITDLNNMGAAMAAAAYETIKAHITERGADFDKIYTGDLGVVGSDILCDMLNKDGLDIYAAHEDCGKIIYDLKEEDVHAGGSGCGCFAGVFCGHIYKELTAKKQNRVLAVATGALMNAAIVQQGESIPAIAHAVEITSE